NLASGLYVTASDSAMQAPAEITFEYADGEVAVRKTFRFDHSYVVGVETSVTRNQQPVAAYPAWPAGFGDQVAPANYANAFIVSEYDGKPHRQQLFEHNFFSANTWVAGGNTLQGPFYWAGAVDQYFAALFMPDDPQSAAMVTFN